MMHVDGCYTSTGCYTHVKLQKTVDRKEVESRMSRSSRPLPMTASRCSVPFPLAPVTNLCRVQFALKGFARARPPLNVGVDDTSPTGYVNVVKNVLNVLSQGLEHPKPPCFSESCSACIGLKPGGTSNQSAAACGDISFLRRSGRVFQQLQGQHFIGDVLECRPRRFSKERECGGLH